MVILITFIFFLTASVAVFTLYGLIGSRTEEERLKKLLAPEDRIKKEKGLFSILPVLVKPVAESGNPVILRYRSIRLSGARTSEL